MKISRIILHDVSKEFNNNYIFKNAYLSFSSALSYAITGPSGSGKSTLLNIIAGFLKPTSGAIFFDDKNSLTLSEEQYNGIRRDSFGFVFQDAQLLPELTVIQNVIVSLLIKGFSYKDAIKQAQDLLNRLGLENYIYYYPDQLSGGQQQRVALARALIKKPSFLYADEPTGNLDAHTAAAIIDIMLEFSQQEGVGLIVSSHDPFLIARMQKVLIIESGILQEKEACVFKEDVTQKNCTSGRFNINEQIFGNGS